MLLRISAATTPARTSDDLPTPEGPTTANRPESRNFRRHAATSVSLPKNKSASLRVVGKQSAVGAAGTDLPLHDRIQGRVLPEHLLLELDQLAAGV